MIKIRNCINKLKSDYPEDDKMYITLQDFAQESERANARQKEIMEMQGKENLLLQERMLEAEQALETEAIGFAEWIKQNNYHQFGSSDSVSHIHPNHRGDDRYRFNGLWYNTINIAEMNKPITTAELFNLYKNSQGPIE